MIVPDKFNMVDMEGIDLLRVQGVPVEGIYDKLVESIALCRYQCLYNWMFNDILIPPTYVEMEVGEDEEVVVNFGITVTTDDVIHLNTIEPPPVEPVIVPLLAEENMVYNAPSGVDGFDPVTVDVPSYVPVLESISITQNGTYTPPLGVDGYSLVTVDVETVELMSAAEWGALTNAEKRTHGLVAIEETASGYLRGKLVNGADYIGEILQMGTTGQASITVQSNITGEYYLVVIDFNSEASTHQLNISASINNVQQTGETVSFNSYSTSGDNRRNYRFNKYLVNVNSGDNITIQITDKTFHSSFVWALLNVDSLTLDKAISKADSASSGSNTNDGFVLQGTFNDANGGTLFIESYDANTVISTENPGSNYKSSYIFWFTSD